MHSQSIHRIIFSTARDEPQYNSFAFHFNIIIIISARHLDATLELCLDLGGALTGLPYHIASLLSHLEIKQ